MKSAEIDGIKWRTAKQLYATYLKGCKQEDGASDPPPPALPARHQDLGTFCGSQFLRRTMRAGRKRGPFPAMKYFETGYLTAKNSAARSVSETAGLGILRSL
jgi:hypothetical protein